MDNETMVNQSLDEGIDMDEIPVIDDLVEEPEEEPSESIESLMGGEEEKQPDEQTEEPEEPKAKGEPGYVKGRIEKAVQKAIAETRAEMQAEFDRQLAPFRERMIEDEAQELVRSRKISDIETAREYVRMKNGQPLAAPAVSEPEPKQSQPRQANGQFTRQEDPATKARVSMLNHQAEKIKEETGLDVTAEFMSNPEIKKKVVSGEMDFYDVAKQMQKQPKKKAPPSPTRTSNGVNGQVKSPIMDMSSKQFNELVKRVQGGTRFRE